MNPEEITLQIIDDMAQIGGIATPQDFYNEFNFRLCAALGLPVVSSVEVSISGESYTLSTVVTVSKCLISNS